MFQEKYIWLIKDGWGKSYGKPFDNKLIYEGDFKDDRYNGKGKIYDYKDGYCYLRYEGMFLNGNYHGKGKEYY